MGEPGLFGMGILRFPHRCFQSEPPPVEMRPLSTSRRIRLDWTMLQALAQDMGIDLSRVEFRVTRELPSNFLGMMWEEKRGYQVILFNEDFATANTTCHECFHAAQAQGGWWRPFRLGYEAQAARAGDAYEWRYRGILIREA